MQELSTAHILSPFAMVRVSGVDPAILNQLVLTGVLTEMTQLFTYEHELDHMALPLEDALFRLVPRLEGEKEARRITLAMKRGIHNRRRLVVPPTWLADVSDHLTAEDGALLNRWAERVSARDRTLAHMAEAYGAAVDAAATALRDALRQPALEQGVSLASATFWDGVRRAQTADWQAGSGLARTATAYLARTAVKTSPFSTLTCLELAALRGSLAVAVPSAGDRILQVAQSIRTTLAFALAYHPHHCKFMTYRVNESLRQIRDRWTVMAGDYGYTGEFAWRNEQLKDVTELQEVLRSLTPGEVYTYSDLIARLPDPGDIPTLVRCSALLPVLSFPEDAGSLGSIAAWLEQISADTAVIEALLRADAAIRLLATADGDRRVELVAAIRQHAADAFTALCIQPPIWLKHATVVYEDVRGGCAVPELPSSVAEDLDDLCRQIRPCIVRSHLYDAMVEWFVHQYGSGGVCHDALAFLTSFQTEHAALKAQREAVSKDKAAYAHPSQERMKLSVSPSTAPPTISVYAQLAAESYSALQRGDYVLVCNQLTPGLGGAFSRFTGLFDDGEQTLSGGLRAWLKACYDGAEPLDLMVAGDWNNAQAHPPLSDRVLQWPLELLPSSVNSVSMLQLAIEHEPHSNTLIVHDTTGRPVAPVYASTVPHFLMWGPLRSLMLLVNPWFVAGDFAAGNFLLRAASPPPSAVVHTARRQSGRIVTKRAQWHLPAHLFPTQGKGESDFAYFIRVQRWRNEWDIPQEVFLSVSVEGLPIDARVRKPVWLQFGSPHALQTVRPLLAAAAGSVTLTECLPRRDQCWFRTPDGSARATEIQVMCRWPRP